MSGIHCILHLLVSCMICRTVVCVEGKDSKGRDFIFGFMDNIDTYNTAVLEVFITTDHAYAVTVNVTMPLFNPNYFKTLTVKNKQVFKIRFSFNIRGIGTELRNKGIQVQSDYEIAVFAVNKAMATSDAFVVFPFDTLGQSYYVITWNQRAQFLIVATEDSTIVTITPGRGGTSIHFNSHVYRQGMTLNITMNRYQTFHSSGGEYSDFSGTYITSNKPIAVFSGSQCSKIGSGACDHLSAQMTPVETFGTMFVTINMASCSMPVSFRILASENSTQVNISGRSPVLLSKPGDIYTFSTSSYSQTVVSSDKPTALAFFAQGGCSSKYGDPAMILLPPIQQFAADYTFSTIEFPSDPFRSSLTIVIPDSEISGLLLDRQNLSSKNWRTVSGSKTLRVTNIAVTEGSHTVYHTNPTVTFLAVSTGITTYNSYGYSTGQRLAPINSNCSTTIPVPGDIVDNDCDGLIDEELNDGRDNDGDGSIDEDIAQYYDIDECASSPCQNDGDCVDLLDEYRCHCSVGYTGLNCEIDIDECASIPCMHGGLCNDMVNSYNCSCKPGYVDYNCEIDVDECFSSPCQNNATCIDKTPGWNCECLPGYYGRYCEKEINECQSNPCRNNGTCLDLIDDYKCICTNESSGQNCEKTMDHCSSSPCLHGGECNNLFDGFTCQCLEQWHGEICEYKQINRTQECTDLEYTECNCFVHRLIVNKKSKTVLVGSIGFCIGLLSIILSYCVWMLFNMPCTFNRIRSERHVLSKDDKTIVEGKNSETSTDTQLSTVETNEKKPTKNIGNHSCFIDHTGFDFSKVFVNKDGSRRIVKCRHHKN